LDGAVYGQPLVLGDLVIVATEGDSVYGLSLAKGRVRWQRQLGAPVALHDLSCGNIDPLGITGTLAIDPKTGAVQFIRTLDVTTRDRHAEQQRGALAVAGGRVYVPFGGSAGDCGNYIGYVTAQRRSTGRRRRATRCRARARQASGQRFGAAAVRRARAPSRLLRAP
jgi:polyvinyl alcohol dehydrogenase (cytochrome)